MELEENTASHLLLLEAEQEIARLKRHVEELQEKVAAGDCACSYDQPGDVCMMHSPTVDRLKAQLPEGMEHCTILFKECEKGHGWLTATNWVQHGCPHCEAELLEEGQRLLRLGVEDALEVLGTSGERTEGALYRRLKQYLEDADRL